jgi:hypothetical protein
MSVEGASCMTDRAAAFEEPQIEAYDWIETSRLSELVANFARVHILVALFDGDPDKWLQFIAAEGTLEEREHDVPFIERIKERLESEPHLIDEMRLLVRRFSRLFARVAVPA